MTYDLSEFRLQPGDLVEVHNGRIGMSVHIVFEDGRNVVKAKWDHILGNRGTVIRLWQPHPAQNEPPWVIVEPLPEFGHGEHTFASRFVHKVVNLIEESEDDQGT